MKFFWTEINTIKDYIENGVKKLHSQKFWFEKFVSGKYFYTVTKNPHLESTILIIISVKKNNHTFDLIFKKFL